MDRYENGEDNDFDLDLATDGEWVKYSEVESLEAEVKALKDGVKEIKQHACFGMTQTIKEICDELLTPTELKESLDFHGTREKYGFKDKPCTECGSYLHAIENCKEIPTEPNGEPKEE